MRYGDISAAFLQGEYLPDQRPVLVATPRGYPDFVQRFPATKLPSGSRTDMLRLKKGGFGLAESPRMWFLKLKKTVLKLGGQEWSLIPGVFSFFQGGRVIAMVACHVDDIRMIGSTEAEAVWKVLKEEFSFGEWRSAQEGWQKFCGRHERQLADFSVEIQMDEYGKKVEMPPQRGPQDLTRLLDDAELKWVGHVCGQLNWLARQCRGDLLFGVSRAQQLAGCKLPDALAELKILVERAREPRRCRFVRLDTEFDQVVFLIASDASFGAMPRSRSQGGTVLMVGHPAVLEGQGTVNVLQFSSSLLKRVVKSSLAAEISQAAEALDDGDFLRAVVAAATSEAFALKEWMATVSRWKLVLVLDTKTGYDLLQGANHGEDRRLAIDVAAMKESLHMAESSRLVRWVPGPFQAADDLTKLMGNGILMKLLEENLWSLKDTEESQRLRADAALRKKAYRARLHGKG